MSRSRKLKKSNKPIIGIVLIALAVCIAFIAKKGFFGNERFDEVNVNKNIIEESTISEVVDTFLIQMQEAI